MVCLHESRAVASALGECLQLRLGDGKSAKSPGDLNVWNVDNAAATFKVCSAAEGCPEGTNCLPKKLSCLVCLCSQASLKA